MLRIFVCIPLLVATINGTGWCRCNRKSICQAKEAADKAAAEAAAATEAAIEAAAAKAARAAREDAKKKKKKKKKQKIAEAKGTVEEELDVAAQVTGTSKT